ncbi:hypothetical protein HDR58_00580 [bacterium]|nr:hypothetical protein [bacterium]
MNIHKIGKSNINLSTRILRNKTLLNGLEKISEHGTSFSAGTSLLLSLTLRPISIFSTPDTEKENKQYAAANSICSGLIKFGMVEAIALPIEYAVKNIDKNPEKFLKKSAINNFRNGAETLANSRSYKLLTQMLKLSTGFFTAIPKSILTIALIPILMDKLFLNKKINSIQENKSLSEDNLLNKKLTFTGRMSEVLSHGIGKVLNIESVQKFAQKYQTKDKDIAKHMTAGTDILLTSSFVYQTSHSDKIKENRKKALIYNNIISTAITLFGGYGIDRIIKNKTGKFIEKFKLINAGDPKIHKYIEGINILRPALIFAGIYYGILPIISTYTAEKVDKFIAKQSK